MSPYTRDDAPHFSIVFVVLACVFCCWTMRTARWRFSPPTANMLFRILKFLNWLWVLCAPVLAWF